MCSVSGVFIENSEPGEVDEDGIVKKMGELSEACSFHHDAGFLDKKYFFILYFVDNRMTPEFSSPITEPCAGLPRVFSGR